MVAQKVDKLEYELVASLVAMKVDKSVPLMGLKTVASMVCIGVDQWVARWVVTKAVSSVEKMADEKAVM